MSLEQEFADAFSTLKQRVAEALSEEYEKDVSLDDFELELRVGTNLVAKIGIRDPDCIPFWTPIWTARGIGAVVDTMTAVSRETNQMIYAAIREGVSR